MKMIGLTLVLRVHVCMGYMLYDSRLDFICRNAQSAHVAKWAASAYPRDHQMLHASSFQATPQAVAVVQRN